MAADVAEFLWNKSLNALKEAEAELSLGSYLIPHFEAIRKGMEFQNKKKKEICSSIASEMFAPLYDLNDVLAECRVFAQQSKALKKNWIRFNTLTEFYFIYKMKRRLNGIENDLKELWKDKLSPPRVLPTARLTFGEKNVSEIDVFDKYKFLIESILFEDGSSEVELKAIAIVGMGGIGKTAIAREIFNSHKMSRMFSRRIWVCLSNIRSNEQDIEVKILKCILEAIGYDVDLQMSNLSVIELLGILKQLLLKGRYLIVLDDVWHIPDSYANLNERLPRATRAQHHFLWGLPSGYGGAVIVTSRLEEVARRMVGEKYLIHVRPLLDQDQNNCWKIFEHTLHGIKMLDEENKKALDNIEYDIKCQCHGLPLAAKTLAKIISEKI